MAHRLTVGDVGEKELIRTVVAPLFNPDSDPSLPGDDCGVAWLAGRTPVCISTDRVPWDLISFRLGLIDLERLGHYLAVLNLSDLAAMGARPIGMVLNLAFPADFLLSDLNALLAGIHNACREHGCQVLGGDLSDAVEPNLTATVIGTAEASRLLLRSGIRDGDLLYCSAPPGLTSTAFRYFLDARTAGLLLAPDEERLLIGQFSEPMPRLSLGRFLGQCGARVTCMDNTDGFGQTLSELGQINDLGFEIDAAELPIHDISRKVADFLEMDVVDLALGPGADFQLIGTISEDPADLEAADSNDGSDAFGSHGLRAIGRATSASNGIVLVGQDNIRRQVEIAGWNYFANSGEGEVGRRTKP